MPVRGNLLIVEDNTQILDSLTLFLEDEFSLVAGLKNPELIPSTLQSNPFDLVLLDMNFTVGLNTGSEGLYWLKEIFKIDPTLCVIMMTAYGDVDFEFKIFYDLKSYKQERRLWYYSIKPSLKKFIDWEYDVFDLHFEKASMGTGRRWYLLYRIVDNPNFGAFHNNYKTIYEDFLKKSGYISHIRSKKLKKLGL